MANCFSLVITALDNGILVHTMKISTSDSLRTITYGVTGDALVTLDEFSLVMVRL